MVLQTNPASRTENQNVSKILTHMQVKRSVRKGNKTFFVMVRSLDREGLELDADSDMGSPPPPNPVCPKTTEYQVDPQRLKELLDEYPHVFPDSIPGLPPGKEAEISIPLQEGTRPLNRPMFRYSPAELEEMQAQVEYLLQRDLIRPNISPFGAPVLFVK